MLAAFYNEAQVTVGDDTLRLVVNMRTIDATEQLVGMDMPSALQILLSPSPPLALGGKVVWGMLREHHPDVSLDQALGLMFGDTGAAVGVVMGDLLRRSFHLGEEAKDTENPPKRRGASKSSLPRGSKLKQEA